MGSRSKNCKIMITKSTWMVSLQSLSLLLCISCSAEFRELTILGTSFYNCCPYGSTSIDVWHYCDNSFEDSRIFSQGQSIEIAAPTVEYQELPKEEDLDLMLLSSWPLMVFLMEN